MRRVPARCALLLVAALLTCPRLPAQSDEILPASQPLVLRGDISREMVAGIDRYALRELARSAAQRGPYWQRDLTTPAAYQTSVRPNRERLQRMIGAVDERRSPAEMQLVATTTSPALLAETGRYRIFKVRWGVFAHVHGEGLLLEPKAAALARVVVLPDADVSPEELLANRDGDHLASQLAEAGCQVVIPTLIDRRDEWSGNPQLGRFTNQSHREWIYRQAFEMGRHLIGYEVQKVLAVVDWFERENRRGPVLPVGLAGNGEGGLIAFHAAALDPRIQTVRVSGYFDAREEVWREPLYRNVFGLLREFGDAEIASLIAGRGLAIAPGAPPRSAGPRPAREGRSNSAAPGRLTPPAPASAEREFERARGLVGSNLSANWMFSERNEDAARAFWSALGRPAAELGNSPPPPAFPRDAAAVDQRQLRQLRELESHTQALLHAAEDARHRFFWQPLKPGSAGDWHAATQPLRKKFREDVIGPVPAADLPAHPRTRKFGETEAWTGYEVMLDVRADLFAWGYLLLPKDLKPGERRPVVVCQHGLEGLPEDTVTADPTSRAFGYYKAFAARLAERGFVVFSPHNPYRARDDFRVLQRKLNPLGQTLYGVILAQHERILDWLETQPFVDATRIGFYGLSYGGKTALRLPALMDRYAVSICSGDFNEWIRKNTSVDLRYSYMFTAEYEIFEFNLGPTFNYAEMAALIAPRPFMVERGHNDGVGTDEWVSYEYAKVRRLYTQLGIPERTAIEYFNGPHTIHGVGSFEFLHRHLNWPKR